jgi:hypothetical protein
MQSIRVFRLLVCTYCKFYLLRGEAVLKKINMTNQWTHANNNGNMNCPKLNHVLGSATTGLGSTKSNYFEADKYAPKVMKLPL